MCKEENGFENFLESELIRFGVYRSKRVKEESKTVLGFKHRCPGREVAALKEAGDRHGGGWFVGCLSLFSFGHYELQVLVGHFLEVHKGG